MASGKLGACWAILRGRALIWRTEIRYGEVDCYGKLPATVAGRSLVESCHVTLHPGWPDPKEYAGGGFELVP